MAGNTTRTKRGEYRIPMTWEGRQNIAQVFAQGAALEMRNEGPAPLWPGDGAHRVSVWAIGKAR